VVPEKKKEVKDNVGPLRTKKKGFGKAGNVLSKLKTNAPRSWGENQIQPYWCREKKDGTKFFSNWKKHRKE